MTYRFDLPGTWGGGATFTERELKWTGENTIYSTWNDEGLYGPRAGERVNLAPAIWGILTFDEFLRRHGDLPTCEVWLGEEELGVGCDTACARSAIECGEDEAACLETCNQLPRALVDCIRSVPDCELARCEP